MIYATKGQHVDTIRIYDYQSPFENWILKLKPSGYFSLQKNDVLEKGKEKFVGKFLVTNSSIKFLTDTSTVKEKDLLKKTIKKLSTEAGIAQGDTFRFSDNLFYPLFINYSPNKIPEGIIAEYSKGDGFGGYSLKVNADSSFEIKEYSCLYDHSEKGKWMFKKGKLYIKLGSDRSFNKNDFFYVTEYFIIGKVTKRQRIKSNNYQVIETYLYYIKAPDS